MGKVSSVFKKPEGELEYMAAYKSSLELWNIPLESYYVSTRFGETHVIESGSKDDLPLILLHASSGSSTMWAPNIEALSKEYRTYALDIMGEVGKSNPTNPMISRSDCNSWLSDVLKGLKIETCFLAGQSKGAWLALNFSLSFPKMVEKLVLLGPSYSFAPVCAKFYLRFILLMLFPTRPVMNSFIRWTSAKDIGWNKFSECIGNQMFLGMKNLKLQKAVVPNVFTDEELRSVEVPTLLLIGDKEVLHNPYFVVNRAKTLISDIEADIIPNAGHSMTMDQPDLVNKYVLEFLKK